MLVSVYQKSPRLSCVSVLPGWWSLNAPVVGAGASSGSREAAGLVNASLSGRKDPHPVFSVCPHPEARTAVAVAVVNPGGVAVKLQGKTSVNNPSGVGDRGVVRGRSRKSRRRLMDKLSRVDMAAYAAKRKGARFSRSAFVTLTYPAAFCSWEGAKEDLAAFRKRLGRSSWACEWVCWVEEYQARGAVHFHLVIVWARPVNLKAFRGWLSRAWYEVVRSEDPKHLAAGTQAVAVHLSKGVGSLMGYLAGEMGKIRQTRPVDSRTGELIATGRTWGFWNEDRVPFVTVAVIVLKTWEAWKGFKARVGVVFSKSAYLRHVPEYAEWRGGLLYGDGCDLVDRLCSGLAFEYRSVV